MLWAMALLGLIPTAFAMTGMDEIGEADDDPSLEEGGFDTEISDGYETDLLTDLPGEDASGDSETQMPDHDVAVEVVISPNDPELPDEPGPLGEEGEAVIAVNDPELPDAPGPLGGAADESVTPDTIPDVATGTMTGRVEIYDLSDEGETFVLPDDAMQGGTDAKLIWGGDGAAHLETEGTLNIVTGGAGADVLAAGDDAAIMTGGAGADVLYGGDGSAVLSGGDGDDVLYAGDDIHSNYVLSGDAGADRLFGGAGNDVLILDRADVVSGGEGTDDFFLYSDSDGDHAQITDFAVGADVLHLKVDQIDMPDLDVRPTDDGLSSQVSLDGVVVAVLQGTPNATVSDIVVELAS